MDIFDLIQDATKEANSFEDHPAKELSLEERLLYLNGLSLVMNSDAEIDEDEKEYIRILIKSFDLDESCLNDMVTFAQSPDKDTIQAFFRAFRRKPLAQLFLFDAYMMGMRDGEFQEKEMAVIDKIAEQLEILKGTKRDIFDLFCHIKNKDWQESSLYFSSHLLNPDYFKHLLEYYEVDIESVIKSVKNKQKEKLRARVLKEEVDWIPLKYNRCNLTIESKEITSGFVNLSITYGVMMPFIQSMLDRGEAILERNSLVLESENKKVVLLNIYDCDIRYDSLARSFSIAPDLEEVTMKSVSLELIIELFKRIDLDFSPKNIANLHYSMDPYTHGCSYFPLDKSNLGMRNEIVRHNEKYYCNKDGEADAVRGMDYRYVVTLSLLDILTSGRVRFIRKK